MRPFEHSGDGWRFYRSDLQASSMLFLLNTTKALILQRCSNLTVTHAKRNPPCICASSDKTHFYCLPHPPPMHRFIVYVKHASAYMNTWVQVAKLLPCSGREMQEIVYFFCFTCTHIPRMLLRKCDGIRKPQRNLYWRRKLALVNVGMMCGRPAACFGGNIIHKCVCVGHIQSVQTINRSTLMTSAAALLNSPGTSRISHKPAASLRVSINNTIYISRKGWQTGTLYNRSCF